jgi:hypothetical protein
MGAFCCLFHVVDHIILRRKQRQGMRMVLVAIAAPGESRIVSSSWSAEMQAGNAKQLEALAAQDHGRSGIS